MKMYTRNTVYLPYKVLERLIKIYIEEQTGIKPSADFRIQWPSPDNANPSVWGETIVTFKPEDVSIRR